MIKIKTIDIEVAVANYFGVRQNIIVPNISWGIFIHECDLLIIRPSGYAIEVEIKVSVQDLKNDFLKKHNHKDSRIKQMYYAIPEYMYNKALDLIPINCGIITVNKYDNINDYYDTQVKREAKINDSKKLTQEEINHVAHLGCMRIFTLKRKIIGLQKCLIRNK